MQYQGKGPNFIKKRICHRCGEIDDSKTSFQEKAFTEFHKNCCTSWKRLLTEFIWDNPDVREVLEALIWKAAQQRPSRIIRMHGEYSQQDAISPSLIKFRCEKLAEESGLKRQVSECDQETGEVRMRFLVSGRMKEELVNAYSSQKRIAPCLEKVSAQLQDECRNFWSDFLNGKLEVVMMGWGGRATVVQIV